MLVVRALRKLAHLMGGNIHHEDVKAAIVIEVRKPFTSPWAYRGSA